MIKYLPDFFKGLLYSYVLNKGKDIEIQHQQGNSPNRNMIYYARLELAVLPVLPLVDYCLPTLEQIQLTKEAMLKDAGLQYKFKMLRTCSYWIMINVFIVIVAEWLERLLLIKAPFNSFAQRCLLVVQKVQRHLGNFLFGSYIFFAFLAMYAGMWLLPASFLFFNLVYVIQTKKLYSDKTRDRIDNLLFWTVRITAIVYGSWLEQFFFTLDVIGRCSRILENSSAQIISILKKICGLFSGRLHKELAILENRLAAIEVPSFTLATTADNFYETLQGLSQSPRLRVNVNYVQTAKDTTPLPLLKNINSLDVLTLFNAPELTRRWPDYHEQIVECMINDWKLSSEDIDFDDQEECLSRLHKGLTTYITAIRNGDLPGTLAFSAPKLKQYLDNVTDLMHKAYDDKEYDLVIKVLLKLGIEGGNNCSIGKGRAVEEAYRMLVHGLTAQIPPATRIAHLLQQNREIYFQQYISQAWFIGMIPRPLLNFIFHSEDTHGYNHKIALSAPRLGLPALSAQIDLEAKSGSNSFMLSLLSRCEQVFWRQTTVETIQGEVQAAITGTHQFKTAEFSNWYRNFLERLQFNAEHTDEILAASEENSPYQYNGNQTSIQPDFLTLMLLDMGVLYLEGDNSWGNKITSVKTGASCKPYSPLSFLSNNLTYGFNRTKALAQSLQTCVPARVSCAISDTKEWARRQVGI